MEVQLSQEMLRVQRREERERRKREMEHLRNQKVHATAGHSGLGTRVGNT